MSAHPIATVNGFSNILSINVSDNHGAATSTATITSESTSVTVGDIIDVYLGYQETGTVRVFMGYVKSIEEQLPEHKVTVTAQNVLVRALDYFIVSSNPNTPFTRQNISAEALVGDLLGLAGITSYQHGTSNFTLATQAPVEINLVGCYDYCKFIADIIAWHIYADNNGVVHFEERPPFPQTSDVPIASISESGMLQVQYSISDVDLRNRVVVYGAGDIFSEAKAASPYLPAGFYKSMAVSAPTVIDTQSMADDAAQWNLAQVNRLTKRMSISIPGDPNLEARKVVSVSSSISGASGNWYIYGIEHSFSRDGFITSVDLRA